MKNILIFFLILTTQVVQAQEATFSVNNTSFVLVKKTRKNEYQHGKDTILQLYRIQADGQLKYLLSHDVYAWSGDCNNVFEDIGSYSVEDDKIIFYTEYLQEGNDPIPEKRKQIYQVLPDGKLIEIYDKQYYSWSNSWVDTPE